mgnify:FL=1
MLRKNDDDSYVTVGAWLSAECDATWILESREHDVGPVGRQILQSARAHLDRTLRAYLTGGGPQ